MKDCDCVTLLRWALPSLHLRWAGFRKVRGQVCKRIQRRLKVLGLSDSQTYRAYLERYPREWAVLDSLCRVTISHFCRDRGVFSIIENEVMAVLGRRVLAGGGHILTAWSVGCASGEEPYSLALLWELAMKARFPTLDLDIVASDADQAMIRRAKVACYSQSSLEAMPPAWRSAGFDYRHGQYCLKRRYQDHVTFRCEDIRHQVPVGLFDIILCRNLVFTYFDSALQLEVLARLWNALSSGGALVIGSHETLPPGLPGFAPWQGQTGIYKAGIYVKIA